MATVDPEKKLQSRVLHWLKDDLGYTYIGDLRDIDNTPIKEDLLSANLLLFLMLFLIRRKAVPNTWRLPKNRRLCLSS